MEPQNMPEGNYYQQPTVTSQPQYTVNHKSRLTSIKSAISKVMNLKVALFLIVLVQVGIGILLINPFGIIGTYVNVHLINEVSQKTTVNPSEVPVILPIKEVEKLKSENAIQSEIYKDAADGDYALFYSDRLIIYRRPSGQIIYNGPTPTQKFNQALQDSVNAGVKAAVTAKIVTEENSQSPSTSIILDLKKFQEAQKSYADFYKNAKEGDIVIQFPAASKIVVFRPSTSEIIASGSINSEIVNN